MSRGPATPHRCARPLPSQQRQLGLPWKPLLSRAELRRGLAYYGSGARLQALVAKLLAGQPVKVFALGGSVTGGGGSSYPPATAYVSRFFQWINATFPHRWGAAERGREGRPFLACLRAGWWDLREGALQQHTRAVLLDHWRVLSASRPHRMLCCPPLRSAAATCL